MNNLNDQLIHAVMNGSAEQVNQLLEHGADPNTIVYMATNLTVLMCAVCRNDTNILKLLIDAGANVNAVDITYLTALYKSLHDTEKSKLLIDAGADIPAAIENCLTHNDMYKLKKLLQFKNLSIQTIIKEHETLTNTIDQQNKEITNLKQEIEQLQHQVDHLLYRPGGPGYEAAHRDFDTTYQIRCVSTYDN